MAAESTKSKMPPCEAVEHESVTPATACPRNNSGDPKVARINNCELVEVLHRFALAGGRFVARLIPRFVDAGAAARRAGDVVLAAGEVVPRDGDCRNDR